MRKSFFLTLPLLISGSYAYAGSVELSTYYPAPFGVYDRLRLVPRALLTEPCEAGTFYYETGVGLQFCDEATRTWGGLGGGVWTQSVNNIYPSDTVTNPNLKVGIGTTTPLTKLHLYGTSVGLEIRGTDSADNEIVYQISQVDGSGAYVSLRNEAQTESVKLSTFGNSHFTGGNVGIGTTAPAQKLHVVGHEIIIEDPNPEVNFKDTNGNDWEIAVDGNNMMFERESSGTSAERMRITSDGNVGIGTTNPLAMLHIEGSNADIDLYGSGTAHPGLDFHRARGTPAAKIAVQQNDRFGSIDFRGYNGSYPRGVKLLAEVDGTPGAASIPGRFMILTKNNGTADPDESMRIDSQGNVSIGTTGPTGKLTVLNTANTADLAISNEDFARSRIDFLNGDTTAEARIQSESGGNEADLVFSTVSNSIFGERMRIDFNGNVGIGTMSPASSLQVNGYIQLKLTAGVPPAVDCDAAAEEGRMVFDPTADKLYICSGVSGWVAK